YNKRNWKKRSLGNPFWHDKLFENLLILLESAPKKSLLEKYINQQMAVSYVASIQKTFRTVVRDAVDKDSDYGERLSTEYRFGYDFDFIKHIANKSISIGDLVSYQLQPNDLSSLAKMYSTMLKGRDFYSD